MSHPYAPRIGPAIGGALPGLPQRTGFVESDLDGPPTQAIVVRAATGARQAVVTPSWATRGRVTALGRGGQGRGGTSGLSLSTNGAAGGGGAGLAATLIEDITPNTLVDIQFTATATLVEFLNYRLSGGNGGTGGTGGVAPGGVGGIGSGGAINFNGGAGGTVAGTGNPTGGGGGGGAAGRGGNGDSVGDLNSWGANGGPGDAYATGGGAGGAGGDVGGVRFGAISRTDASLPGAVLLGKSTIPTGGGVASTNCDGGDGGGGSGGAVSSAVSNIPGAALVLIELW